MIYLLLCGGQYLNTILEKCKGQPELSFNTGDVLFNEGDKSGKLLVLIEGEVEILKGMHKINNVSAPGSIFGEISVLLNLPHMATVKVIKPSRFYELTNTKDFFEADNISWQVAILLAQRLNNITNYIVDLKQWADENEERLSMVCQVLETLVHQQNKE